MEYEVWVMTLKCIAFDCFWTVFDMADIPPAEIRDYVSHVRRNDFSPYQFPDSWRQLHAWPDSSPAIARLQDYGYRCVALSNGTVDLVRYISESSFIYWDTIIDLVAHRVYKPHLDAYRTIENDLGFRPDECLMVTANPTFGDLEGAAAIGMKSQVIRHGKPNTIIELADMLEL